MTLSPQVKKNLHAAAVGFTTGALSFISALAVGVELPGVRALVIGVLTAGMSRAAGSVLAAIETKEVPPEPKPNAL